MNSRNVTVKQFVEAMRKNGYEQGFGNYIVYDDRHKVISACAIGQAALNLKVQPSSLHSALRGITDAVLQIEGEFDYPNVVQMNDSEEKSLNYIADKVEKWAREKKVYTKSMGAVLKGYE